MNPKRAGHGSRSLTKKKGSQRMKRCSTCGSTYTDDTLVYCLQDGATLISVSDAQSSFDPEATLRVSAEENLLPPAQAFNLHTSHTLRQPASPLTVPPRAEQRTSDNQAPVVSSSNSSNPFLVAGITAIAVLLLVIAGIGIALLVRGSSSSNGNATAENSDGVVNKGSTRNASNTANDNGSAGADNSSNKANTNAANRNGSTSTDAAGRAEAKVVRGTQLEESDLTALSGEELRRLRNTVYARHGRTFDSVDLQRYFDKRPWYKPRSDYNEAELTQTDRANIKLIQTVESNR